MRITLRSEHVMSRRSALALLGASVAVPFAACKGAGSSQAIVPAGASGGALHYMSLHDVARRIAARELSPVDLTQHMLDRIAKLDPTLKSYATVMHDLALADAHAAEQEIQAGMYRGPLHGVPIAVKDLSSCSTRSRGAIPTIRRHSMRRPRGRTCGRCQSAHLECPVRDL
jgi:hypothetical protein